jgi:hypothetical protein
VEIALVGQAAADNRPDLRIVVDDEDTGRLVHADPASW